MSPPTPDGLTTSPTTFECSICYEPHLDTSISIKGDTLCKACFTSGIKPQFLAALKDESQYPVRWGNAEINILDFAIFFEVEFLGSFAARQREYAVLPGERVYCAGARNGEGEGVGACCGSFLGVKTARPVGRKCNECEARTCSCCASAVDGLLKEHKCEAVGADEGREAFAELKRGADYQKCPGCGGVVQLQDGCNHLVCRVPACGRTNFCYICGEEAREGSGHWDAGRPCPKYNQPGADNAMFDGPGMGMGMFDAPGMGLDMLAGPPNLHEPPLFFHAPFIAPARREALTILHNRSNEDLRPDSIQPADPPELILRKLDRRELDRIANEARNIATIAMANRHALNFIPPPRFIDSVIDFASMLGSLVEVYTIHLETDAMVREIVSNARDVWQGEIMPLMEEVGVDGFERFPTLRRIAYRIAVRGLIEELRRQRRA